jgi:hypothetical protein
MRFPSLPASEASSPNAPTAIFGHTTAAQVQFLSPTYVFKKFTQHLPKLRFAICVSRYPQIRRSGLKIFVNFRKVPAEKFLNFAHAICGATLKFAKGFQPALCENFQKIFRPGPSKFVETAKLKTHLKPHYKRGLRWCLRSICSASRRFMRFPSLPASEASSRNFGYTTASQAISKCTINRVQALNVFKLQHACCSQ